MAFNRETGFPVTTPGKSQDTIKEIVWLFRRLMHGSYLYNKELHKKYQVSIPQLSSILALYEYGSLPPSHIAKLIMVNSSTVTGIIDRLERKGLVERSRVSPDRRVITISLTEKGRKLAENAPPPLQNKIVDGLNKLTEQEKEKIVESLSKLTYMMDGQDLEIDDAE